MLTFDLSAFERRARELGGQIDQLPFALANTLNAAVFKARETLVAETWPKSVTVRNRGFIRQALRVEPATKANLSATISNTGPAGNRGHLKLHAQGGVKAARGNLAIPTKRIVRTSKGVRESQKPRNLRRAVVKGGLIFQAVGSGKNKRLQLMYRLTRQARIKPDVPFYRDFRRVVSEQMRATFPAAMAKAMASRRR